MSRVPQETVERLQSDLIQIIKGDVKKKQKNVRKRQTQRSCMDKKRRTTTTTTTNNMHLKKKPKKSR